MEEAICLPPFDECPTPNHCLIMNIIAWNCRGALKPSFQNHVRELVQNHDPAMMIIMKTRIGGDQARDITDKLPFDGAIHINTIGFMGGLWLLWNSNRVQVTQLAMSEQEIHVLLKVLFSKFEFICSAIYASPRFHERCILWNNLEKMLLTFMISLGLLLRTLMRFWQKGINSGVEVSALIGRLFSKNASTIVI